MRQVDFEQLDLFLEEEIHLVVTPSPDGLEVIALVPEQYEDAFPLPLSVQAAAAQAELILDTKTAAHLDLSDFPPDFWGDVRTVFQGDLLGLSELGRAGQKYLAVYWAVSRADGNEKMLTELDLSEGELASVARWVREAKLFDHRAGDALMAILGGANR